MQNGNTYHLRKFPKKSPQVFHCGTYFGNLRKFLCHLLITDGKRELMCEYPRNLFSDEFVKEFCESFENVVCGLLRREKLAPPQSYQLVNGYGPTETTIIVTTKKVCEKEENIPIGAPMSDVKIYVTDKNLHRLPVGAAGELVVAGPQVGRGYLNHPEKTAAVFIRDPFSEEKSDYMNRAYRTGDIVRWRQNGEIEFIGRRDSQIKIHGYRIELKEIESTVREFSGISDVTVQVFDGQDGEKHIIAYVVSGEKVDAEALTRFIGDKKPAYMVPAVVMQLEKIPLNVNGKVDKRNLPAPQYEAPEETAEADRAMTSLEEEIADVIEAVLGHRNFGVETGFANAGLSSISAIRFAIELERHFGVSPNVKDLQNNGNILTVENFLVDSWRNSVRTAAQPETVRTEKDSYPLTQTQLGIYLESLMDAESDMYNIPILMKTDSSVDEDRLEKAILTAVEAHPFLKCRIEGTPDGSAVMLPRNDYPVTVKHSGCTEAEIPEKYGKIANIITLDSDALFDFEIIRTEASLLLRMNFHHIIMDGSSLNVLLKDIEKAYIGETPEKETYTSFDLASDEENARKGDAYKKAKAYYDSVFENVSVNSLPSQDVTDLPAGTAVHKSGNHEGFELAKLQVLSGLNSYLEKYKSEIGEHIKIWITGYSRGAATANLAAAALVNGEAGRNYSEIGKYTLDNQNVYCYGFETPKGTCDVDANDEKYSSIFNLINPIDIIPYVGPEEMGFCRYGKDLFYPTKEMEPGLYNKNISNMESVFLRMFGIEYCETFQFWVYLFLMSFIN